MSWKRSLLKAVLGSAVILGAMAVSSVPALADSCAKVREERRELNRAIARHGYWSPQAEHERRDLRNAEASCYRGRHWRDRDDRRWRHRDWDHDRDDRRWRHGDGDHDRDDRWRHRDRDHDRDRDRR